MNFVNRGERWHSGGMGKRSSRPRDLNKLSVSVVADATDERTEEQRIGDQGKDPAAVSLGRRGGLKGYRSYLPDQDLPPPSMRDWLPEHHLAYFVSDVVDQLDLSEIHAVYEKDLPGQPPYDPRMMTKLLVYGYCVGVYSARKIQ